MVSINYVMCEVMSINSIISYLSMRIGNIVMYTCILFKASELLSMSFYVFCLFTYTFLVHIFLIIYIIILILHKYNLPTWIVIPKLNPLIMSHHVHQLCHLIFINCVILMVWNIGKFWQYFAEIPCEVDGIFSDFFLEYRWYFNNYLYFYRYLRRFPDFSVNG